MFGVMAHSATATVLFIETVGSVKGVRRGQRKAGDSLTSFRYNQEYLDGRGISSGVYLNHKRIQ